MKNVSQGVIQGGTVDNVILVSHPRSETPGKINKLLKLKSTMPREYWNKGPS